MKIALRCTQTHLTHLICNARESMVANLELKIISDRTRRPIMLVSAPGGVWNSELAKDRHEPVDWLWDGLLASGAMTLLTGSWKAGKSTLVSLLLDRRRDGGQLLGRTVRSGGAIVVSEEEPPMWARRQATLDFGPRVCFFCRPFTGTPSLRRWRRFVDTISELVHEHPIDLLVLDPVACFLPAAENHAASLVKALSELQHLTEEGLAVLLLHHPKKGVAALGQAARGSGALPAFVDIVLELRVPRGSFETRRRRLHGFSRFAQTPRSLLAELNAAGTDYVVLPDTAPEDMDFDAAFEILQSLLTNASMGLTRAEILAHWPQSAPPPHAATLWRWLARGCERGTLVREGTGSKAEPFRYRAA
jgi:hypothetical protein